MGSCVTLWARCANCLRWRNQNDENSNDGIVEMAILKGSTEEPMANKRSCFSQMKVVERLPHWRGDGSGDLLPNGLVGASVVRFGTISREDRDGCIPRPEGGGLVIDYVPKGSRATLRTVFSFSEEGMWIVYNDVVNPS